MDDKLLLAYYAVRILGSLIPQSWVPDKKTAGFEERKLQ